jgi:hypothetical protein
MLLLLLLLLLLPESMKEFFRLQPKKQLNKSCPWPFPVAFEPPPPNFLQSVAFGEKTTRMSRHPGTNCSNN